jgi:hypothetical protein
MALRFVRFGPRSSRRRIEAQLMSRFPFLPNGAAPRGRLSGGKRTADYTSLIRPTSCFWPNGNTGNAAPQSLTFPRFLSICPAVDTWPNRWALCLATDRHARFRPFSKHRSTDAGADPSAPRFYVHRQKGISLCLTQLCSALTGKRALASFNRLVAAMTSSTPGVGSAS